MGFPKIEGSPAGGSHDTVTGFWGMYTAGLGLKIQGTPIHGN